MYLLYRIGGLGETEIGEMMGGRLWYGERGWKTITGETEKRQASFSDYQKS
jgi:hypothetical protein